MEMEIEVEVEGNTEKDQGELRNKRKGNGLRKDTEKGYEYIHMCAYLCLNSYVFNNI
jgi:hypothetical protein